MKQASKMINMNHNAIPTYIKMDYYSITPKYKQLADSIVEAIQFGKIKRNAVLPSINEISFEFDISRDTVERGYKYLKDIGVLGSVPGKGFYIKNTEVERQLKVLLLFNKLGPDEKIIYDSLKSSLAHHADIDLFIYDSDFVHFQRIMESKRDGYTHYVIIPHFNEGMENAHEMINSIDKDKLILLDKILPGITGKFGAVYENFEKDIYQSLIKVNELLVKYDTLKIIFPKHNFYPKELLKGFHRFCYEYGFASKVVYELENEPLGKGEVYINLLESDLGVLIEKILAAEYMVGKDIGVISYNETPLKKYILNGITTMSTNFQMMGKETARLILEQSKEHLEVPSCLTLRPSL